MMARLQVMLVMIGSFDKMSNLGFEHTGFHKGFDPCATNSLSLSVRFKR